MKFSTRARYGLRLCFLLAVNGDGQPVPLSVLVKQSNLSEKYSEQLLAKLKKAGIVGSVRGKIGGYSLKRAPKDISVRAVLEALDDGFSISDCAGEDTCDDFYCPNRSLFRRLYSDINGLLERFTLQDMADEQNCGKRKDA